MTELENLEAKFQETYRHGKYKEAADLGAEIAAWHEKKGDLLSAAEMKNNRSVALLKAGQPREALAAASGTDEIFASTGDVKRQAIALGNQAAALEDLGELEQAAGRYETSARLLQTAGERELFSTVMKSLSAVYMKQGKPMDTVIALQTSLEDGEKLSPREKFIKKLLKRLLSFLP